MAFIDKIDYFVKRTTVFFKKYPILILVLIVICVQLSTFYTYEWMRYQQFDGTVEDVTYNIKKLPTVTINGKNYQIYYPYTFPVQIEKGDKMIKRRGNIRLLLIKPHSKDTIDFTRTYQTNKP